MPAPLRLLLAVVHSTRACVAVLCAGAATLAAGPVSIAIAHGDPSLQMRVTVVMLAVASSFQGVMALGVVLLVADNFGLRLEMTFVAGTVFGATCVAIAVVLGLQLPALVLELLMTVCHIVVYNVTVTASVVRSFRRQNVEAQRRMTLGSVTDVSARNVAVGSPSTEKDASVSTPTPLFHSVPPTVPPFDRIMASHVLRGRFRRFLVREFQVDSLLFWEDVEAFRAAVAASTPAAAVAADGGGEGDGDGVAPSSGHTPCTAGEHRMSAVAQAAHRGQVDVAAGTILHRYLAPGCRFDIRVSHAVRQRAVDATHALLARSGVDVPTVATAATVFAEAQAEVAAYLRDVEYPRLGAHDMSDSVAEDTTADLVLSRVSSSFRLGRSSRAVVAPEPEAVLATNPSSVSA